MVKKVKIKIDSLRHIQCDRSLAYSAAMARPMTMRCTSLVPS